MTDQPTAPLGELLRDGVPEAPPLTGLAAAAESRARTTRGRRRGVLTGAIVVAVTAAALTPALLDRYDDGAAPTVAAPSSPAVPVSDTDCRPSLPVDNFPESPGVYVRFCPVTSSRAAIVPDVVVLDGAQELADNLDNLAIASCAHDDLPNPFRLQVGFADGSATQVDERDGFCGGSLGIVMEAIAEQESRDLPPVGDVDLACGQRPTRGDFTPTPPLASSDVIRSLPVRAATLCVYRDGAIQQRPLSPEQGEQLRIRMLSDYIPGITRCTVRPGAYVRVVLFLADASTHQVDTDSGCRPFSVDNSYVGLAGPLLSDLVDDLVR